MQTLRHKQALSHSHDYLWSNNYQKPKSSNIVKTVRGSRDILCIIDGELVSRTPSSGIRSTWIRISTKSCKNTKLKQRARAFVIYDTRKERKKHQIWAEIIVRINFFWSTDYVSWHLIVHVSVSTITRIQWTLDSCRFKTGNHSFPGCWRTFTYKQHVHASDLKTITPQGGQVPTKIKNWSFSRERCWKALLRQVL